MGFDPPPEGDQYYYQTPLQTNHHGWINQSLIFIEKLSPLPDLNMGHRRYQTDMLQLSYPGLDWIKWIINYKDSNQQSEITF